MPDYSDLESSNCDATSDEEESYAGLRSVGTRDDDCCFSDGDLSVTSCGSLGPKRVALFMDPEYAKSDISDLYGQVCDKYFG